MMRCEEAAEAIATLTAGEIDPAVQAGLETHLRGCRACSREAAATRDLLALLGGLEVPDPGPVYWEAFGKRLRSRLVRAERRSRLRRWLQVAAAAVLLAGLVLAVRRPGAPVTPPAPAPETTPPALQAGAEEARLLRLLRSAASGESGAREVQAILDEMVPGDPLELDDALGSFSPKEREELSRDLSGT